MNQYDWSKLGPYWWYDENKGTLIYNSQDGKGDLFYAVPRLEQCNNPVTDMDRRAMAELDRCRIAPPVTSDQYDWSRLEGSGWEARVGACVMLESERWCYYIDSGYLTSRTYGVKPSAEESWRVHNEVYALVARCRRDWRDEVKQACEGTPVTWHDEPRPHANVTLGAGAWASQVRMHSDRTWQLFVRADTIETLLVISLIIERLKKLGWREA